MQSQLDKILQFVNQTGDKAVLFRNNEEYVVMKLDDYNNFLHSNLDVKKLSESEMLGKINREIAIWRQSQQQALDGPDLVEAVGRDNLYYDYGDKKISDKLDVIEDGIGVDYGETLGLSSNHDSNYNDGLGDEVYFNDDQIDNDDKIGGFESDKSSFKDKSGEMDDYINNNWYDDETDFNNKRHGQYKTDLNGWKDDFSSDEENFDFDLSDDDLYPDEVDDYLSEEEKKGEFVNNFGYQNPKDTGNAVKKGNLGDKNSSVDYNRADKDNIENNNNKEVATQETDFNDIPLPPDAIK